MFLQEGDGGAGLGVLVVLAGGVSGAIVMANHGDTLRAVLVDGNPDAVQYGLDGILLCLFGEDAIRPRIGDGVHVFGVETLLEEMDYRKLHSSVHAINGCAETH